MEGEGRGMLCLDSFEVTAAHICYLVAEANCESYSDTARICLIGADHLKFPRTHASPDSGWILHLFDSTAHRVVGGLPLSVPSTSLSGAQCNEHDHQKVGPRVSNSQSTMAMPSLMPSASTESEWKGGNNRSMHNRSISEPDFGKTPRKEGSSLDMQEKASGAGGSSSLGRIGSQIFQKTVGLVLRSRSDRQAKLGEKNKFYYDENLKR
ncbi:hypothetical protein LOK49_LG03G02577 [Camellia lanceoleosa]|uniref:Uncharacterized protein n=1 Tax=Camellia lanceoleosa TaxID=1840588 RepID=A0ACC0IAJ8_9ERIC|nr:hypothetical protein LOK49_LG03G02577 [Camellia lanceoleosa]